MSKEISFTHTITKLDPEIVTKYKYGVRRPDGTIDWDYMNKVYEQAATDPNELARFHETLRKKAKDASIDPEQFIAGHEFVRRMAIISITAPETIPTPALPKAEPWAPVAVTPPPWN